MGIFPHFLFISRLNYFLLQKRFFFPALWERE